MGYPTTTFDLYTDEGYKGSVNIVGDATQQWANVIDAIAHSFPCICKVVIYKMNGEQFMDVSL